LSEKQDVNRHIYFCIGRLLADEKNAMSITMRAHYGQEKKGEPTPKINDKFIGPMTVWYDLLRAAGWDIFTHGGFVTYAHHDAAGFCTFVFVRSGAKLWTILSLKGCNSTEIRAKMFERFDEIITDRRPEFSDDVIMGSLLLEENDFL
jgi:hypothetical protein